ncbi:MAG: hypothetical protein NZ936_09810, partial [Alphaproteobacteria bacterium]|nr:hypothetical protein [Alphaproteobacteria bacterium]
RCQPGQVRRPQGRRPQRPFLPVVVAKVDGRPESECVAVEHVVHLMGRGRLTDVIEKGDIQPLQYGLRQAFRFSIQTQGSSVGAGRTAAPNGDTVWVSADFPCAFQ